jgi:hypothetical protein
MKTPSKDIPYSAAIRCCCPTNMGWPKSSGLRNYRFIINSKHNPPWVTCGYEPTACIKRHHMVHNRAHNSPQLVSTLSQTNSFHPLLISNPFSVLSSNLSKNFPFCCSLQIFILKLYAVLPHITRILPSTAISSDWDRPNRNKLDGAQNMTKFSPFCYSALSMTTNIECFFFPFDR